LLFPSAGGGVWTDYDWRNWRKRVYKPLAASIGLPESIPYDLRHSFASLLIREGLSVVDVARQMGHSPTVTLNTYSHVFEEFEPGERVAAAEAIRAARGEARVRERYAADQSGGDGETAEAAAMRESRRADSNRGPLHYE
jgi:integrase